MAISIVVPRRRLQALVLAGLLAVSPTPLLADSGPDPEAHAQARGMLGSGLLLIPESTNDRVMAFDPATGDLVDADFIPADVVHLTTPINVILNAGGDGFLVSDQSDDVVQEYDLGGNFVGTFAPAGGVDNSILDAPRGIVLRPGGNLLVTVGSGANADSVAEFDAAGNFLGNFVANGAAGLTTPFDVSPRAGDYLVSGFNSGAIHRYNLNGSPLANLAPINSSPEQIAAAAGGNVLVANFGGAQEGVVELDAAGTVVGVYDPPAVSGYRGVHELPNGNILTTDGNGVHEIDRLGNLVETKVSGVSARFIELVVNPSLIFADGFESGDVSRWSSAGGQ